MKRRSLMLIVDRGIRLCVAVRADRLGGDLFLQRLAPGDAVGRFLAALVREPARRTRSCSSAALLSLRIAVVSATFATALGALVALALHRVSRLRGRLLLSGMITAPLVMPEIITGLSLLFLFISMADLIGWPMTRGATTITIAHITFSMAYVVVVVRSRLAAMDESLEEAAMDLGGRPLAVFFDITVPMLLPALVSGWLLSFTLSLDDLVISSFVSGPGATTLPMLIFAKVRLGVTPDINAITTDHHRAGGRRRCDRGNRDRPPASAGCAARASAERNACMIELSKALDSWQRGLRAAAAPCTTTRRSTSRRSATSS